MLSALARIKVLLLRVVFRVFYAERKKPKCMFYKLDTYCGDGQRKRCTGHHYKKHGCWMGFKHKDRLEYMFGSDTCL